MSKPAESAVPYLDWLSALYCLLAKARNQGLLSIEADAEDPENEYSIFSAFPKTLEQPYLGFAADLLCMCVGGNLNSEELKVYAEHAISGHAEEGPANLYLLKTIWLTIWASASGYSPQIAAEFGRQAIPVREKPSRAELHKILRELQRTFKPGKPRDKTEDPLDTKIDCFIASLND